MADQLSGNLPETGPKEGAQGGVADQPGAIDPEAETQQEPTAGSPWTHHIGGSKVRLVGVDPGEEGPDVTFEVLDPDVHPPTGAVVRRTVPQAEWDERAVPFTVDQAEAEVLPGDQAPSSETAEPAEASRPTLVELAKLAGVKVEPLPDESFILRGKDLPEGGLFVEPDKLRGLLERIRDGTWRDD